VRNDKPHRHKEEKVKRNILAAMLLVATLAFGASAANAQMGYLSAVHGIPGLEEAVDVYVNGDLLFSFEYGETFGPAAVDTGDYNLEVYYKGSPVPGLSGMVTVTEGGSFTAVAHLDEGGAIAPLALFVNEVSPVRRFFGRLQIHHLAAAPTVDASIRRGWSRWPKAELSGLSNGEQATAIDVSMGQYNVALLAGDAEVFNTGKFRLRSGDNLAVYAVGLFPDTFQLIYLPLN
jgi:hypothetical protein